MRAILAKSALVTLLALPNLAAANQGQTTIPKVQDEAGSPERFNPYEDSYAIWNKMGNDGWSRADEWALRTHYSFKYSFCGPVPQRRKSQTVTVSLSILGFNPCPEGPISRNVEIFFAYTGAFDFYLNTRESGPVINRLSEPGIYARLPLSAAFGGQWNRYDSFEIGFVHRSNGQVGDPLTPAGARTAQRNYERGNHRYFDTISRGSNYLSFALDRRNLFSNEKLDLNMKLRVYLGRQDSNITWGPLANKGRRFSDYDRLELRASYQIAKHHRLDLQWHIGDKGFATDSISAGWLWNSTSVPVYLRIHHGPMNTLSNYTQNQTSIGLGLLFSRF